MNMNSGYTFLKRSTLPITISVLLSLMVANTIMLSSVCNCYLQTEDSCKKQLPVTSVIHVPQASVPERCAAVVPKTYFIADPGHYGNRFMWEYLDENGWVRSAEPNERVQFMFADALFEDWDVLEQSPPNQLKSAGCVAQIRHIRSAEISKGITQKNNLPGTLATYEQQSGERIDFLPLTHRLFNKSELREFLHSLPCEKQDDKMWMFKKVTSSRGKNIYLENDPSKIRKKLHLKDTTAGDPCGYKKFHKGADINKDAPWGDTIVQEYISDIPLINGHKFHIRGYWVVASLNPLLVLYYDSFVLVASEEFSTTSTNIKRHITNYSFTNKVAPLDDTHLPMSQFQKYLDENGGPQHFAEQSYINQITRIGEISWRAIESGYKSTKLPLDGKWSFLATDIVLNSKFEVKLLEWQKNPGLVGMVSNCGILPWACKMMKDLARSEIDILFEVNNRKMEGSDFSGVTDGTKFKVVIDSSSRH